MASLRQWRHLPKNTLLEKPIEFNTNDKPFNDNIIASSKPTSSTNVSKRSKHISQNENIPESKTDQNGVYKLDESEDIDTILKMFEKPKK